MKAVLMSRNVYLNNEGWTRISLSEEEAKDILGRVRYLNIATMEQCLKDAELLGKLSPTNKVRVAIALFNKLALHSFSAYQDELGNKAHLLKNGLTGIHKANEASEKEA